MDARYAAYTASVVAAIGENASPRVRDAFPVLLRKLHEAVVETGLTNAEWLAACALLIEAGKVSSDTRNELVLISDVLGVESLVDMIEHSDRSAAVPGAASSTPSAVLGPFYIDGIQTQPNGTSIIRVPEPNGTFVHLHGTVTDPSGAPSSGAQVDIWQDAPNGLYDSQSGLKNHCRGRFETDSDGRFCCITVKPEPYPIPFDSSAGKLLKLMDRHPNRPAHIHLRIVAAGCATLVTQLFDRKSKWLDDDAVFAVKDALVVDFVPTSSPLPAGGEHDGEVKLELCYNVQLSAA